MTQEIVSTKIVGRIIWVAGDLFNGEHKKNFNTGALEYNQDGTPKLQYSFGLAVPKDVAISTVKLMQEQSKTIYPKGAPPSFAWKFRDGDELNSKGEEYPEHYKGCLVFNLSTFLKPKFYVKSEGAYVKVEEGINNGDYVEAHVSMSAHPAKGQGKPGMYLNHNMVRLIQKGEPISTSAQPEAVFGSAASDEIPDWIKKQTSQPNNLINAIKGSKNEKAPF